MMSSKKKSLLPILESSEGIHLTAYLVNKGDLVDLKSQLLRTIEESKDLLLEVLSFRQCQEFLEPLSKLLDDARILSQMNTNIGLFRTKDSFRILSVPVKLERQCHVASSFHVKPILKCLQFDREFLLLGLEEGTAHLYLGSQSSFRRIDSIFIMNLKDQDLHETAAILDDWISQLSQKGRSRLFWVGNPKTFEKLINSLRYKNLATIPLASSFKEGDLSDYCQKIRRLLHLDAKRTLKQALLEFQFADEYKIAKKNIFQIAKAAIQGRVKKLVVADDVKVFGKVDRKTGGLAIHPLELDHEDDDILDDLAQTVLASGGEVLVAPRGEIPNGRPIIAILENQENFVESSTERHRSNLELEKE